MSENTHVIGVHRARRLEDVVGVELHARAQPENVFRAVVRDGPAFRQAGLDGRAALREFDEVVEHGPAGVHAGRRGDDLRVQRLGIALRAEDERLAGRWQREARVRRHRERRDAKT